MNLCSLDFDGALHKASDSVLVNFRDDMPAWQMEIALKAQMRFAWSPLLVPLLENTDVSLIIHSTWRKRFSDSTMKQFLPPELASRLISLDGQIEGRRTLIADDYVMQAIELLDPVSVCVIDDRPDFFEGGRVQRWMDGNQGCFIWTDPEVGIQSLSARGQFAAWSHSDLPGARPSAPSPS